MNKKNDKNSVNSSDGIYKRPVLELVQNAKEWHPTMDNRGTGSFGGGFGGGGEMDKRLAVLETNVNHIDKDIGEIKSDLRGIRTSVESSNTRLDNSNNKLITILVLAAGVIGGLYFYVDNKADVISKDISMIEGDFKKMSFQNENISKDVIDLRNSIEKMIKHSDTTQVKK